MLTLNKDQQFKLIWFQGGQNLSHQAYLFSLLWRYRLLRESKPIQNFEAEALIWHGQSLNIYLWISWGTKGWIYKQAWVSTMVKGWWPKVIFVERATLFCLHSLSWTSYVESVSCTRKCRVFSYFQGGISLAMIVNAKEKSELR